MRRTIVAIAALVFFGACGGGSGGNCDNPPSLQGNWSGSVNDNAAGLGTLGVSFTQDGCRFGGTWQSNYSGTAFDNSGTLSGRSEGASLAAELTPSNPGACGFDVVGTLVDPGTIAGTFAATNCSVASGGSFEIRRVTGSGPAICGNNVVEAGEQCDDGSRNCPNGSLAISCPFADSNPCCADGCVRATDGFCGGSSP
jgi:hypothetical protein